MVLSNPPYTVYRQTSMRSSVYTFWYVLLFFSKKKNVTLHCTCISFEWKLFYVVFFFCRKLHWLKRQLQLKGNNSFFLSLSFTLTCILIFIDCDRIKINHFKCGLCTVYLQLFFFYFFFFRLDDFLLL